MRFVIGYLGIPADVYDNIYKVRDSFAGNNVCYKGFPLGRDEGSLSRRHSVRILREFCDQVQAERPGEAEDVAYAVIYVKRPGDDLSDFEEIFFPSTFIKSVEWVQGFGTKSIVNQSKNELIKTLRKATEHTKSRLIALRKELSERSQRTPLLLPLRNFSSNSLVALIKGINDGLNVDQDPGVVIRGLISEFDLVHPPRRVGSRRSPCYIDDNRVEFHAPGKALHGLPRAGEGHKVECILGGRRRLGAPYHPAFHYDCIKGQGLKGDFFTCHSDTPSRMKGNPHLNISPNDFIR